jgi:aryl-alcohol dehydrogenase-like predicted oxidoreductase
MQTYAEKNGLTKFILMQDFYTAIYREEEREMFPTAEVCCPHLSVQSPSFPRVLTSLLFTRSRSSRSSSVPSSLTAHTDPFHHLQLFGCGIIPWSPLARGYLTRPWKEQDTTNRAKTDPNFSKVR